MRKGEEILGREIGKAKDVSEKGGRDIGEGDREREGCKEEGGEIKWWGWSWGKGRIGHWGREVWGMGKGDRDIWDKHPSMTTHCLGQPLPPLLIWEYNEVGTGERLEIVLVPKNSVDDVLNFLIS